MKAYKKIIYVYKFEELEEHAKNKAIYEHRNFLLSIMTPNDFISGDPQYDTEEELQKAYESEYNYYLFEDEPIIESIECNDYNFTSDGELIGYNELSQLTAV
jgi:hypothetical protein